MAARIPIFVSAPSTLSPAQDVTYKQVCRLIESEGFERRALGRTDYPSEYPLKEVLLIARNCYGGMILGFSQADAKTVTFKPGTPVEKTVRDAKFPTAWNNLEAGILFALRKPLMVFHEAGVGGGVFDPGVTDVFLQDLPAGGIAKAKLLEVKESVRFWSARVRSAYRDL